ncbi:MAG: Thymidylate synthase [Glaciihabitans sp.]|jgi:thymidylate synthase|nr:Thymidylate synthase [Glaciihabitans sp.]
MKTANTVNLFETATIGEAWLSVAHEIVASGRPSRYDGLPILEIPRATLEVDAADPDDPIIARYADAERLAWMRTNFVDHDRVAALGDARSYASRLYDYAETGRDQIAWVIERLRTDPSSRSATITTFEPLIDTTYIPCVSMLDFWIPGDAVELVAYAHSIDFGAKGYANLIQLAELLGRVGRELDRPAGRLSFVVKSAHIYDTELDYMKNVLRAAESAGWQA